MGDFLTINSHFRLCLVYLKCLFYNFNDYIFLLLDYLFFQICLVLFGSVIFFLKISIPFFMSLTLKYAYFKLYLLLKLLILPDGFIIWSGCLSYVVCSICWFLLMVGCFLECFKCGWLSYLQTFIWRIFVWLRLKVWAPESFWSSDWDILIHPLTWGFLWTAGRINLNCRTAWQQTCGYNFSRSTFPFLPTPQVEMDKLVPVPLSKSLLNLFFYVQRSASRASALCKGNSVINLCRPKALPSVPL